MNKLKLFVGHSLGAALAAIIAMMFIISIQH